MALLLADLLLLGFAVCFCRVWMHLANPDGVLLNLRNMQWSVFPSALFSHIAKLIAKYLECQWTQEVLRLLLALPCSFLNSNRNSALFLNLGYVPDFQMFVGWVFAELLSLTSDSIQDADLCKKQLTVITGFCVEWRLL